MDFAMLANLVKKLFAGTNAQASSKEQQSTAVNPLAGISERRTSSKGSSTGKTILALMSDSRSDALAGGMQAFATLCREGGYELAVVDTRQENCEQELGAWLERPDDVFCAFSPLGFGDTIKIDTPGGLRSIWERSGIPFIAADGDHPAYFWERHVNLGNGFASLYFFREHLDAARAWTNPPRHTGLMPVFVRDPIPRQSVDFTAKRSGNICFFKNGNDPRALVEFWRSLPNPVSTWLFDLVHSIDILQVGRRLPPLHGVVRQYLADRDFYPASPAGLEAFLVAQIDDYARRVKSTLMAEALLDLPICVFGDFWGHVDFTGRRATHLKGRSHFDTVGLIADSLCVMDMSPNTESAPHERFTIAAGRHTLCLSNAQKYYEHNYPDAPDMLFDFSAESLRHRVGDALARPKHYVDLGVAVAERAATIHPPATALSYLIDFANMVRFDMTQDSFAGQQTFVMWPPQLR